MALQVLLGSQAGAGLLGQVKALGMGQVGQPGLQGLSRVSLLHVQQ